MNPIRNARNSAGFTLIELLSVIVIVGILVAIAAPRMDGSASATKLERAREQLIADIAYTRMLAIREGRSAALCLATLPTATEYEIRRNAGDCTATTGTVAKKFDLDADYPGVEVQAAADGVATSVISFNSRGFKSANQGALVVTMSHGSRTFSFDMAAIGTVIRND